MRVVRTTVFVKLGLLRRTVNVLIFHARPNVLEHAEALLKSGTLLIGSVLLVIGESTLPKRVSFEGGTGAVLYTESASLHVEE